MEAPLYKYLRHDFAEAAIVNGEFRIGTLYEFRAAESYDSERADSAEGTKHEYALVKTMDWRKPHPDKAFVEKFIAAGPGANIQIRGTHFVSSESSPDLWLYCTSKRLAPELFRGFGADACLEIRRPSEFLEHLSAELVHLGMAPRPGVLWPCNYMKRRTHYRNIQDIHPASVKDPRYRRQAEVRFVWDASSTSIAPTVIHVPAAKGLLTVRTAKEIGAEA